MLLFHKVSFPVDKAQQTFETYLRYTEQSPQDTSIATVVTMGLMLREDRVELIAIKRVEANSLEKALVTTSRYDVALSSQIEGYRFTIEPMFELQEALALAPTPKA